MQGLIYDFDIGDRHKKYTNLKKVSFPVREHIETLQDVKDPKVEFSLLEFFMGLIAAIVIFKFLLMPVINLFI